MGYGGDVTTLRPLLVCGKVEADACVAMFECGCSGECSTAAEPGEYYTSDEAPAAKDDDLAGYTLIAPEATGDGE